MVQMGLLGALLTFSGSALYAPHLLTTQALGMSPLQDQQLAGLIMWVPAAGLYLGAAMFLLARWFRQEAARGFEIGRAHVLTPVTNAQLVCRLLIDKTKNNK